jgi:hypothetical protein
MPVDPLELEEGGAPTTWGGTRRQVEADRGRDPLATLLLDGEGRGSWVVEIHHSSVMSAPRTEEHQHARARSSVADGGEDAHPRRSGNEVHTVQKIGQWLCQIEGGERRGGLRLAN